jgi:hypothetical protein
MVNGSVNAPGHFHAAFTTQSITKLLQDHGFVKVYAEIKGTLPVFEDAQEHPPCLVVRGQKPQAR